MPDPMPQPRLDEALLSELVHEFGDERFEVIVGAMRHDVHLRELVAALRVERERNERLAPIVEAARCYELNQMAYERNVLFDALALLAEQEKEQRVCICGRGPDVIHVESCGLARPGDAT